MYIQAQRVRRAATMLAEHAEGKRGASLLLYTNDRFYVQHSERASEIANNQTVLHSQSTPTPLNACSAP